MSRNFPNFIEAYLRYTQHSEAPDHFHYWTAISTLAGAIRRQVWMEMGYFQWVPNFYIVFVAPPGIVSKSTTAGIGAELLAKVPNIVFGPSAVTWQKLVEQMSRSQKVFHTPKGEILIQSAVTIIASEFGTFLDPTNREMVDILVDLWDSRKGEWKKATIGAGEHLVKNPCLNLIACTTPSWIASAFPEYMIGGGFTSRTIFIYAENKRNFVAYPNSLVPEDHMKLREDLISDLTHISKLAGAMTLTPAAEKLGTEWYTNFFTNLPPHLTTANFDGYIARKQTHIHKLAMILSLAESDSLLITEEQLQMAIDKMTALELDMPKVFGKIGLSFSGKKANLLIRFLTSHGELTLPELYALTANSMGWDEFEKSVKDLLQSKRCMMKVIGGQAKMAIA